MIIVGFVLPTKSPITYRRLLIMLITTTLVFIGTSSLLVLYLVFEASLIPILLIITLDGPQPERLSAINYLLVYRVLPSIRILWLLVSIQLDSYRILTIKWDGNWLLLILGLTILVKSPIYGAHSWLALAHVEAPTIGSVVLAGLLLKLGTIGYYRVIEITLGLPLIGVTIILVLGRRAAAVICWIQSDVKAFVAYSSITHINFTLWALASLFSITGETSWIVAWIHGLIASCIFICAGMIIHKLNTRSTILCQPTKSVAIQLIWSTILLINCSVPPTQSFAREVGSFASLICSWQISILIIFIYGIACLHFRLYLAIAHSQVKGISYYVDPLELMTLIRVITLSSCGILTRLLI